VWQNIPLVSTAERWLAKPPNDIELDQCVNKMKTGRQPGGGADLRRKRKNMVCGVPRGGIRSRRENVELRGDRKGRRGSGCLAPRVARSVGYSTPEAEGGPKGQEHVAGYYPAARRAQIGCAGGGVSHKCVARALDGRVAVGIPARPGH
jgi:hypothetical protein